MATISGTVNNGITFGTTSLTITSTGYINAGTNGSSGAALNGPAPLSYYLLNQGRIRATGTVVGVSDGSGGATSLDINNSSTGIITAVADAIDRRVAGSVTNSGTILSSGGYGIDSNTAVVHVTNTGTGLISGYHAGIHAGSGSVINTATITATAAGANSVGIYLSRVASNGSLNNSGLVSGGYAGVALTNGTILNTGTIKSADTHFSGAGFGDGGVRVIGNATISNAGGGVISGYIDGIYAVGGSTLSVTNTGTIRADASATPFGSYGIFSLGGLTVSNTGVIISRKYTIDGHGNNNHISNSGTITGGVAAAIIFGQGTVINTGGVMVGYEGVVFSDVGTVINSGTISGTFNLSGVIFNNGGYVTNSSTGLIQGVQAGVYVSGAAGTVVNSGTIAGYSGLIFGNFANTVVDTGTIVGSGGTAISFGSAYDTLIFNPSSSVTIQGTVDGGNGANILEFASAASTGTLTGVGATFIHFNKGMVDAGAGWVLAGTNSFASSVTINNQGTLLDTGTFTNAGTITGSGRFIIDPATLINSGFFGLQVTMAGDGDALTNTSTGTISVTGTAVIATGSAAVLSNLGTIKGNGGSGYGIALNHGGTITNGASNVTSSTIYGQRDGIIAYNEAATVTNYGTINGAAVAGVFLVKGGTVSNAGGSIVSNFIGVQLSGTDAGAVTNLSGGLIRGNYGLRGRFNTVTNAGTIIGTNKAGINMYTGGTLTNSGTASVINGGSYGISINGGGIIIFNEGTISGNNFGVGLSGSANDTIVNSGTIRATLQSAVKFANGNDLMVANPGAVFIGKVDGGAGQNTLELTSAAAVGTISGLGTSFVNFGTQTIDNGAHWAISGNNTVSSTTTLTNNGTLTGNGSLTDAGTVINAGVINGAPGYLKGLVSLGSTGYLKMAVGSTLTASGIGALGVTGGGGRINNAGAITGGVNLQSLATVTNTGSISGSVFAGVALTAGGTIINPGTIAGPGTAVSFGGAGSNLLKLYPNSVLSGMATAAGTGNVLELASTTGTGTISGIGSNFQHFQSIKVDVGAQWVLSGSNTLAAGETLADLGSLTLTSDISITGAGALLVDPTSLSNPGYVGVQVRLDAGSYLYNQTTGTIQVAGTAVYGYGGSVTVVNAGSIGGGFGGVYLTAGGTVINTGSAALITGGNGIRINGPSTGYLSNSGTVIGSAGIGVYLATNGSIGNAASATIAGYVEGIRVRNDLTPITGTITNYGTVEALAPAAGYGIHIYSSGTITNGSTSDTSALITGYSAGVLLGDRGPTPPSTVTNYGTIAATGFGAGILLNNGGDVRNGALSSTVATISGSRYGIYSYAGAIANYGTIQGYTGVKVTGFGAGSNSVTNGSAYSTSAAITGQQVGVYMLAGTVTNFGTIAATGGTGVELLGGGNTVVNSGTIIGSDGTAVYFGGGGGGNRLVLDPGYVLSGIIEATGSGNTLELAAGGSVGTLTDLGGTTFGNFTYVTVDAGASWVLTGDNTVASGTSLVNQGTLVDATRLTNSGYIGGGITLGASAYLNNTATGTIYYGGGAAIYGAGANASIVNSGSIYGNYGVILAAGGSVVNGPSGATTAAILGASVGVGIYGSAGTVSNFGTIFSYDFGVYNQTGVVSNYGTIIGGFAGINGGSGTVLNAGTVGGAFSAISMVNDGLVVNGASGATTAQIVGAYFGAVFGTGAGTLANYGTIVAYGYGPGVLFSGGRGTVINGEGPGLFGGDTLSGTSSALIQGYAGVAAFKSGTVTNSGTIIGTGSGGYGAGVLLRSGGTVVNGPSGATGALISGYSGIFSLYRRAIVSNDGTIASGATHGAGILLGSGGTIVNGASNPNAQIYGYYGVLSLLGNGSVSNDGTIIGSSGSSYASGVQLQSGGTIINGASNANALITGYAGAVIFGGPGTIANYATISASGGASTLSGGIYLEGGGTIVNGRSGATGALVTGRYGVQLYGADNATITNFGTITGTAAAGILAYGSADALIIDYGTITGASGTAVQFDGGNDRLVLQPGYSLGGQLADGASGTNILELAGNAPGTGTISQIGISFQNFGTVNVDAGASWTLSGGNTIAAGVTLADFGTLTNTGTLVADGVFFVDPATFINQGSVSGAVTLGGGSYLDNAGTIQGTGDAVYGTNSANTAVNSGQITGGIGANAGGGPGVAGGIGIDLTAGGNVTNSNSGAITGGIGGDAGLGGAGGAGGAGISLAVGGSIGNSGTITGGVGGAGASDGISYFSPGGAGGTGISIAGGGTVNNSGTISGGTGGHYGPGPGADSGTGGVGINLATGGIVTNTGTISGGLGGPSAADGVGMVLTAGGYVGNTGKGVIAGSLGIYASAGTVGTVINTGRIIGSSSEGIVLAGGGTIVDSGTIGGGASTALSFGGTGGNLLVLQPGYRVDGSVRGGISASNTLELAGSVGSGLTVSYNGLGLTNFQEVLFGTGGYDTLKVSNTSGTLAVIVSGFTQSSDVIDLTAIVNGRITSQTASLLTVTGDNGTVTLRHDANDATTLGAFLDSGGTGTEIIIDATVPSENLPASLSGNENTAISLSAISVSANPNAAEPLSITLSLGHGTVSAGGSSGASVTLSGSASAINTALSTATFTGDLNYYGTDTLSVVTVDTANAKSVSGSVAITLSDTTVVSENLSAGYSGNENSVVPLGGITVSATPNTGDPLTATLSVAHGTVSAGGSSGTSITLSGTAAAINTAVAGANYTGDLNYYGSDTLSLVTSDTVNNSTISKSATITLSDTTVVSENLSAGYSGNENSVVPLGGITVSAPPNTGDPLTATLSVAHGTVSAGGSSGASITLSGTAAAINAAVAGATYTGDLNYYGSDTLSLVTSDSVNNSTVSKSAAITLSDTTVVGENLSAGYSGNENSVVPLGGITVSAAPNTSDPLTATLTVTHGTVSAGGSSGASITLSGTAAAINTALAGATYTGDLNYYGSDTLSLVTSDTVNSSTVSKSAAITLSDTTAVSENLSAGYSGSENSVVPLGGITVSATPNTGDPLTATLTVAHGTVTVGGGSGASITLSGTAAAINTALAGATYTGDVNYYGSDTLALVTSDTVNNSTVSKSAAITLSDTTAVSETVGGPYSGNENSVVALGGITVSAAPNTSDSLTATLSVAHGTVSAGGSSGASITLSGSATEINTALAGATYTGDLNYYGSDTLSLVTSDTVNSSTISKSAAITLSDTTAVSENLSAGYSGNENSVVPLGGITVSATPNTGDPLTATLSVAHGTVTAGGSSGASITLSGTAAAINTALAGATYTGDLNYYGSDTLSLVTSDTANSSTVSKSAAITLSDTTAVHETLGGPYSGNENSVIALGGITVSAAPNTSDPLTATLSVAHGTVSAGGSSGASIMLSGTAAAINTALASASFAGATNYYGSDTLSLVTSDTVNGSTATGSATITLSDTTAVGETLGGPYSGNENSVIALGGITVSAVPNTTDPLTATLSVSHGTVTAGGSSGSTITLSGTAAAINTALAGANYTGDLNYYGADTLSLVTSDTVNGSKATGSAAITLSDTTVVGEMLGGPYSGNENSVVTLGGITVSASPNPTDPLTAMLSVAHGTVTAGGSSGATITLSGTAAAINTALAGANYTGDLNYYGSDTLSLVTSDTVNGSKATGSAAVTLSDTTVVGETLGGPYSGNENSVVTLGGISVSAAPNTTDPLTAMLSVAHGTVSAGGSSGASIILSGTAAAINTALAGATYTGDPNYYGADTLSLVTSDTVNGSKATGSAAITLSDTTVVGETLGGPYSGNENSVVSLGGLAVSAVPNTTDPLTTMLSVAHGTVSAGGSSGATITLSGTAATINTALGGATYTGDPNYYGPDTLSLVTSDTVNGSTASKSAAITLSDTTTVSETLGGPYSGNENSTVVLGGITVSAVPNTTDPLTTTLSVAHGTVSAGGTSGAAITLSGTAAAINTALTGATYMGDLNYYGPDALSLVTSDTVNSSTASKSAAITLSDTTLVSETLGGPYSGNVNSTVTLGGITVSANPNVTDPLTATLSVAHGTVSAGGSNGAAITLVGTAAAINTALAGAVYTGSVNYVGADTLSLVTSDTVNGSTATGSAAITILNSLSPLSITGAVSGQKTTSQAPVVPFAGVTITDPNSGATETLTIALAGAGGILSGQGLSGGAGGVYTISGSASAVTGVLDALSFTPTGGPLNTATTTGFTITDQSSANVAAVTDSTTSVIDYNPVFGWLVINDPTSPPGEIYTFYEDIFGRAPDPTGFEHWVAAFENGESLEGIVFDFLNSAEYTADFGPYAQSSDETFIDRIYQSALHRQPDPGGLQTYATALASGVSRQDVVLSIVTSIEARADLQPTFDAGVFVPDPHASLFGSFISDIASPEGQVYSLYAGILGRAPDALGFENYNTAFAAGTPINSIAQDLLNSSEYTLRFGANAQNSDATFLTDLYQTALHRPPGAGELQTFENALASGASRQDIAVQIALSPEAQTHLQGAFQFGVFVPDSGDADIARLYYGVLGRAADAAGLLYAEKVADAGVPLVGIAAAFLGSTEYLSTHAGDSDTQFLNGLYQNALGRAPSAAELQSYSAALADPAMQTFDFNSLTATAAAAGLTIPTLTPQLADRAFAAVSIVESLEAQLHLLPNVENGLKVI